MKKIRLFLIIFITIISINIFRSNKIAAANLPENATLSEVNFFTNESREKLFLSVPRWWLSEPYFLEFDITYNYDMPYLNQACVVPMPYEYTPIHTELRNNDYLLQSWRFSVSANAWEIWLMPKDKAINLGPNQYYDNTNIFYDLNGDFIDFGVLNNFVRPGDVFERIAPNEWQQVYSSYQAYLNQQCMRSSISYPVNAATLDDLYDSRRLSLNELKSLDTFSEFQEHEIELIYENYRFYEWFGGVNFPELDDFSGNIVANNTAAARITQDNSNNTIVDTLEYITVFNIMLKILNDDYSRGYSLGYQAGYEAGLQEQQPNVFKAGYDKGYREGWDLGVINGLSQAQPSIYNEGRRVGFEEGYLEGVRDGQLQEFDGFNWVPAFMKNVADNFLSLELIPGFKLYAIIGAPIIIYLFFFIIGIFRGNRND